MSIEKKKHYQKVEKAQMSAFQRFADVVALLEQ